MPDFFQEAGGTKRKLIDFSSREQTEYSAEYSDYSIFNFFLSKKHADYYEYSVSKPIIPNIYLLFINIYKVKPHF